MEFSVDLVNSALIRLHNFDGNDHTYSMSEPIVLAAGLNFLNTDGDAIDLLSDKITAKLFGEMTCSPQHFGRLFEVLLALRSLGGWWKKIPDDDEMWSKLSDNLRAIMKNLDPPKFIFNQRSKSQGGSIDASLQNFTNVDSKFFVLPDNNLGPDGLWKYLCFNCKTSQNKFVDSAECRKNYSKTYLDNWCQDSERRKRFKSATAQQPLVYFQFEFPFSNPQNKHKLIEADENRTIIPVNLDSSITKYIFPQSFIDAWKAKLG